MQSLRDKLLQAGVVTPEQAEKNRSNAEAEKRARTQRAQHPPAPPRPAPVRVESEKDKERRLNREMADRQKVIRALCDAKEIAERGEQAFYYRTRRRELRRLYLLPAQVEALEKGELAIVDRPNGQDRPHALVPRDIAEKILALEERALRFWAKGPGESFGFEDGPTSEAEQAGASEAGAGDAEGVKVDEEATEAPAAE